jgi:hypothetical protein
MIYIGKIGIVQILYAGRPAALKKQRKYMFFGGISPNNVLYSNSTKKNVQNNHQNQRYYTFELYCNLYNYACLTFRTTCARAVQHEFELSTLPSIPSTGHVGGLC